MKIILVFLKKSTVKLSPLAVSKATIARYEEWASNCRSTSLIRGRVFLWESGDHLLTTWWISQWVSINLPVSLCFILKGFVKVWCVQGWREAGSGPRTSDYTYTKISGPADQSGPQYFAPLPPSPGLGCVRPHNLSLSTPSMIHRTCDQIDHLILFKQSFSKIMLCIKLGSYFVHTWFKWTDSSLWSFSNNFQFFPSRLMT